MNGVLIANKGHNIIVTDTLMDFTFMQYPIAVYGVTEDCHLYDKPGALNYIILDNNVIQGSPTNSFHVVIYNYHKITIIRNSI